MISQSHKLAGSPESVTSKALLTAPTTEIAGDNIEGQPSVNSIALMVSGLSSEAATLHRPLVQLLY